MEHSYRTAASIADTQHTQVRLITNESSWFTQIKVVIIVVVLTTKPFLLNVFYFLLSKFLCRSSRWNDFGVIHWHRLQSLSLDIIDQGTCVTNLLYVTPRERAIHVSERALLTCYLNTLRQSEVYFQSTLSSMDFRCFKSELRRPNSTDPGILTTVNIWENATPEYSVSFTWAWVCEFERRSS